MRLIFSMIKNIIAVIAIVIIVYIALKYAPFLKEQDWNPVNHDNDQYIIGQRGDEFILYKFGDESMRVYNTEFEMQQDLNELGQNLQLKPENAYQ